MMAALLRLLVGGTALTVALAGGCSQPEKRTGEFACPAKGIVGALAPRCLVHGAYSRFDGKPVVIIRDLEHHLLAQLAAHLLGHGTGFFRSLVPIFGVVELRWSEHGTRSFSDHSNSRKRHVVLFAGPDHLHRRRIQNSLAMDAEPISR
jgi:hypothetical protein